MSGPRLFLSVFGLVFVAELPDKTAFATVLMATRRHPGAVFLGAAAAFVVQSAVAVAFGSVISLLPREPVRLLAGALFVGFAGALWRRRDEDEEDAPISEREDASFAAAAWSSFGVIFLAEWGDLTQLATAALAARHHAPGIIFAAATLALWTVAGLAVALGHKAKRHLRPKVLQKAAAACFLAVGIAMLAGAGS